MWEGGGKVERSMWVLRIKGSRNNNFREFAPRFMADGVDLREHNRRRRMADVEDCASENRPNMA